MARITAYIFESNGFGPGECNDILNYHCVQWTRMELIRFLYFPLAFFVTFCFAPFVVQIFLHHWAINSPCVFSFPICSRGCNFVLECPVKESENINLSTSEVRIFTLLPVKVCSVLLPFEGETACGVSRNSKPWFWDWPRSQYGGLKDRCLC